MRFSSYFALILLYSVFRVPLRYSRILRSIEQRVKKEELIGRGLSETEHQMLYRVEGLLGGDTVSLKPSAEASYAGSNRCVSVEGTGWGAEIFLVFWKLWKFSVRGLQESRTDPIPTS